MPHQLRWRQLPLAWLAIDPQTDDFRGQELQKKVPPEVKKLCAHLLKMGGKVVAVLFTESPEFCKALIEWGEIISPNNLELFPGEDSQCHANSALLWLQNKENYLLVTGFGLSDDGIWRRHSWIKTSEGKLIETTLEREKYFGLVLNQELAEEFARLYCE